MAPPSLGHFGFTIFNMVVSTKRYFVYTKWFTYSDHNFVWLSHLTYVQLFQAFIKYLFKSCISNTHLVVHLTKAVTPTHGYTILPKGVTNSVGMTKIKMVVTSFYGLAFLGEPVGRAYPPPKNQGKLVQCS